MHHNLYDESDYHDTVSQHVDEANETEQITTVNGKSFDGIETTATDPSELSSGAIICDLASNNRRSKVRRKYFGQRHLTKRPPLLTSHAFRIPIDESEEQSSTFEVQTLRLNNVQQEFASRPRAAHQVRFAPRRARSKPRIAANKVVSTGESSSDERDCVRDNVNGSASQVPQNDRNRPLAALTVAWKQKTVVFFS